MEERIFPNWEQLKQLHNPLTDGEISLLKFLDSNLPRDPKWKNGQKLIDYYGWLIFAQPFFNGTRPDIIIFNPFVGIVIYEVKDWNINNYHFEKGKLYVSDKKGSYPIKTPKKQVEHYKEKLIGQLVPFIGEEIDKNKKNYGLIKTALYFHKAKTIDVQDKFANNLNVKYFPVFGYDCLNKERINEIVPDIKITKSFFWKKEWNEEIIFWLYPPFHSIEQGTFLTLKSNQFKVAKPQSGHHRIRGVAGSGKTQALAYRAGNLASLKKNVLIITFNITLWHYVKDMIARSPFAFPWSQISFNHFHGFCKDKLNENGENWPKSPKRTDYSNSEDYSVDLENFFKVTVPYAVITAIKGNNYQKYDAILIDEGQDYHFEWYDMLSDYFLTSNDEVVVVCDKRQNIYERKSKYGVCF